MRKKREQPLHPLKKGDTWFRGNVPDYASGIRCDTSTLEGILAVFDTGEICALVRNQAYENLHAGCRVFWDKGFFLRRVTTKKTKHSTFAGLVDRSLKQPVKHNDLFWIELDPISEIASAALKEQSP